MTFVGHSGIVLGQRNSALPGQIGSLRRSDLRVLLYGTLALLDVLAVAVAFKLSAWVWYGDWRWHSLLDMAVVTLPVFLLTAFNNGAYSIDTLRRVWAGIVRSAMALLFAFAVFLFISYYFRLLEFEPRGASGIGMAGSFAFMAMFRLAADHFILPSIGHRLTSDVVIMDDVEINVPMYHSIIDTASTQLRPDTRDPMMLDRLARHLRGVDRVIVACKRERERDWAMLLKGAGIHGEIVSSEFDEVGAIGIGRLGDRSTLVVAAGPLSARNRIIKRTFDLAFAVPTLIVLLPVLLLTALAIKMDSRGPVFFYQQRVGYGNALFKVLKFRSMRTEQCDANGSLSASRDDDRITRVGRFIRATSIDELPQLLNVLFGSMSIVGPRPHALGSLAEQQLFWEIDERYWHRHALKPGITGLAQVRGFRGATHKRDDLTRRLQADLEYIIGWSIFRDLVILLSTVRVVVHRNAF